MEDLLGKVDALSSRVVVLETEVKESRERLQSFEERLHQMEMMMERPADGTPNGNSVTGLQTQMENSAEQEEQSRRASFGQPTEWYLPAPTPDGFFDSPSEVKQVGKSIYVLHTTDGQSGHFALLDDADAIATAMISISQFIKPACRIEGNAHSRPKRVRTVEEGLARLEDGGWRVVNKARLVFDD